MKRTLVFELYYSGSWHDLTAADEVYTNIVVTATRFGAWQQEKWKPGEAKASLKNTAGKYNPECPTSPLYGLLALNMPMRVSESGNVLWTGLAAEWRPGRPLGDARRTEVTGGGILRRLGIGLAPITSALMSAVLATTPMAYWPLTDEAGASIGGSVVPGQPGFDISPGVIKMSAIEGPPGDRAKLPELASNAVEGVPALTATPASSTGDSWTIDVGIWGKKTGSSSVMTPLVWSTADGEFALTAVWVDGAVQQISASGVNRDGTATLATTGTVDAFDGVWHQVRLSVGQSGSTATLSMWVDGTSAGTDTETWTPGAIRAITVMSQTTTTVASASIGHITLWSGAGPSDMWEAFQGHPGEKAHTRFARLCTENGIAFTLYGPVDDPGRPMGPQVSGKLLDVLYDCVVTDGGIAYESASGTELVLKTLDGLYRQTPVLTVDVTTDIVPPLDPLIGDKRRRNDVTASRPYGSSARYVVTTGQYAMGSIGKYDTKVDPNPSDDAALYSYASWVASHGTVSGVQYETVVLDLDANPGLDPSAVDIGAVVKLVGIPAVDDPEDPTLLVTAIEHAIGTHRRTMTLRVVSAKPWDICVLDGTAGYLDCGGTLTNEVLDTTETDVDVVISDACAWTHASGDYGIVIGGEHMTVTAVSGVLGTMGTRTQTLTVVRSVNGVVKSHAAGAEVHVTDPIVLAL